MYKFKKWVIALAAVMVAVFALAAAGCKKNSNVTVTYETNGGTAVASASVAKGSEYELVSSVTKEGYEFEGWYLTSDFSGEKVTKVTADADITVYAKWGKLYLVTIDADGGTVSPASVYVKAGDVVANKLADIVPEKTDAKFGEWQINGKALTSSYVMPSEDITVKARYKTKYTVEIYKQGEDGNYVKDEADLVDYAYAGTTPDNNFAGEGFELVNHENSVPVKRISEDASQNRFVLYYNRKTLRVTFRPNYPDGSQHGDSNGYFEDVKFGKTVKVPYDFTAEGYYLAGWSTDTVDAEVQYPADYIYNKLYEKNGATEQGAEVAPSTNLVLYGVWVKGYRDMFGGNDYLYVSETEENVVYMSRENYFFKGELVANGTAFIFRMESGNILEGRIISEGLFAYQQETSDRIYQYYKPGAGLVKGVEIKLDAYNGIERHSANDLSKGTYEIDENGFYIVTYTEGALAGKTAMLYFTQATSNNVNIYIYLERDEEEYNLGVLNTYGISNGSPARYTASYRLNGFGNAALYLSNTYRATYSYTLDKKTNLLTVKNGTQTVGTYVLADYNSQKILFNFDAKTVNTYVGENGATLATDGAGRATLTENGTTSAGYYESENSAFGGKIVRFASGNVRRTFVTGTSETLNEDGEKVTTYTIDERHADYGEYYFAYSSAALVTPTITLNDTAAGHMTVYGYTVGGKYVRISDGTFTVKDGIYTYTKANDYLTIAETKNVENGYEYYITDENGEKTLYIRAAVDIANVSTMTFGTHIGYYQSVFSTNTYWVCYIYSLNGNENGLVKEYVSGKNTLTLVSGIAIYEDKDGGHVYKGNYSISNGMLTFYALDADSYKLGGGNGLATKYFEIDEEKSSFTALTSAPYTIGIRYHNNSYSTSAETLKFDGKGGATYTIKATEEGGENTVYVGTVADTGTTSLTGATVYRFTADGMTFDYIMLSYNNNVYFSKKDATYNDTYVSDEGTLKIDGFGFAAIFEKTEGRYIVVSDGVLRFTDNDNTLVYYFDVNGDDMTKRGDEYGTYIHTDNNYLTGYYFELNGYGVLKVSKVVDGTLTVIDDDGTYEESDGVYTLNFNDGGEKTVTGRLGILVVGNNYYKNFITLHTENVDLYVNGEDWSMLRLDDAGSAVRYDKNGLIAEGNYVLITDTLIYFVTADQTDACIYEIDKVNKSATMKTFAECGYYTENLDSLYFSEYGFAVFGGTRYFYNVSADNRMTIYHQPAEGEKYTGSLNAYGFLAEDFGVYDPKSSTHEPKTFNGKTYYYSSGATITFTRNKVGENVDTSYPVVLNADNKLVIKSIRFRPDGKDEFNVSATVTYTLADKEVTGTGTVVRSKLDDGTYEAYLLFNSFGNYSVNGTFRYDLTLTYSVDKDGNSTSVFSVTSLSRTLTAYSDVYLTLYYLYATILGKTYQNDIGVVQFVYEYDESGEETDSYFNGIFLESSGIRDINGRLINLEKLKFEYNADTGLYDVEFKVPAYEAKDGETLPEHDEYVYRLHLKVARNSYISGVFGYTVTAFTRYQTFESGEYTVEVERLVYSEATQTYGGIYSIFVKKGDEAVTSATDLAIIESTDKGMVVTVMARTYDDNKVITGTKYYAITLVEIEKSDAEDGEILPYKSASVEVTEMNTYYTADGKTFVDMTADGSSITVICHNGTYYKVSECTKGEDGKYTAKISDTVSFEVTLADGKVTVVKNETKA